MQNENEIENLDNVKVGRNVEDVGLELPPETPSHEENKEKHCDDDKL